MKKLLILVVLGLCLYSCNVFRTFGERCRTEVSRTQNGNFIFCALCDSLTFKQIYKNDTLGN